MTYVQCLFCAAFGYTVVGMCAFKPKLGGVTKNKLQCSFTAGLVSA